MNTDLKDFYAGDFVSFKVNDNNYNSDYTCKLAFIGCGKNYDFTSANYDNGFLFEITPGQSQLFDKGFYKVFAVFTKTGFQKTEELTKLNIFENILNSKCVDVLTYNRKMLNAIEDRIMERSRDDYESYTIGNRSIVKMKALELLKWRDYFAEKVQNEESYVNGENKGNKMKIRWIGRYND